MMLNELLEGTGIYKDGSITGSTISTAIRLSRNLKGFPFPQNLTSEDAVKVNNLIEKALDKAGGMEFEAYAVPALSETERKILSERGIDIPGNEEARKKSKLFVGENGDVIVLTNGEDHMTIYGITGGSEAVELWREISRLDDDLSRMLTYAYDDEFGYLTASPGLTGTGLKISETVFLPGIDSHEELGSLRDRLARSGYTIRSLMTETDTWCPVFLIENTASMGMKEEILANRLEEAMKQVEYAEEKCWEILMKERESDIRDEVWRSIGTMKYARKIDYAEALACVAWLRIGMKSHILADLDKSLFYNLWRLVSPAYVSWKTEKEEMNEEEINTWRAVLLREAFRDIAL